MVGSIRTSNSEIRLPSTAAQTDVPVAAAAPSAQGPASTAAGRDVYAPGTPATLGDAGRRSGTADRSVGRWCPTGSAGSTGGVGAPAVSLVSLTTDSAFRVQLGRNSVDFDVGIGGPIEANGGQVGLQVAGRAFTVPTQPGDDAFEVLSKLHSQLVAKGVAVQMSHLPTIDTLRQRFTFTA